MRQSLRHSRPLPRTPSRGLAAALRGLTQEGLIIIIYDQIQTDDEGVVSQPEYTFEKPSSGPNDRDHLSPRCYRHAVVETLTMSGLIGAGLLPALGVGGLLSCFLVTPPTAFIVGALARRPAGRPVVRPPVVLTFGSLAMLGFAIDGVTREGLRNGQPGGDALLNAAVSVPTAMIAVPIAMFLAARAAAAWIQPRLQVYRQLVEYLRVMWIPIGGFAFGYLAIILVFAGFSGMLARFDAGAFSGAGDAGIGEWIAFAFFRALAQDYPGIVPVSPGAWLLVGVQVILAVGWALVVFAAVMSSIQPRLERIARQALQSTGE